MKIIRGVELNDVPTDSRIQTHIDLQVLDSLHLEESDQGVHSGGRRESSSETEAVTPYGCALASCGGSPNEAYRACTKSRIVALHQEADNTGCDSKSMHVQ